MRTTRLLSLLAAAAIVLTAAAGTATASVLHTVRRGETLTSIAATDGLSVSQLAAANGLSVDSMLAVGRNLVIPARGAAATAPTSSAPAAAAADQAPAAETESPSGAGGVVVARGETLSGIAAQYGTSVAALAAANGISVNGLLLAGRRLAIPAGSSASATATVAATASGSPPASAEYVSPSEVATVAAQNGVSPALAQAVADQESGFNNAEISRTGAVGVMQIEPSTWRDLRHSGFTLSGNAALDNIRGGVALLHGLLAQTGGSETQALAGYYQGLQSVRARGMYPSTQRYVRSVLALEGRY